MGKIASMLASVLVASQAVVVAADLEIPLKYVAAPGSDIDFFRTGGQQSLEILTGRPEGSWKLPEIQGSRPIYALARLGGGKRLFIFDGRKDESSFPTRLHFDANGNSDLTDDPVVEATTYREGPYLAHAAFPAFHVELLQEGKPVPYDFQLWIYDSDGEGGFSAFLSTECCYIGEANLDGKRYRFLLDDSDADGVFGEPCTAASRSEGYPMEISPSEIPPFIPGDHLTITDGPKLNYRDTTYASELLLVGDKLFATSLSLPEKHLTLRPIATDVPRVALPKDVSLLTLLAEPPARSVTLYRPAASVPLPPGTYRLATCEFLRKDEQGDLWHLAAQATRASPAFTVSSDGQGTISFGEPYGLAVETSTVKQQTRRLFGLLAGPVKKVLRMRLVVEGRAKERVFALEHVEGKSTKIALEPRGLRPKAPSYKILKRGGEVAAQGSFSYG